MLVGEVGAYCGFYRGGERQAGHRVCDLPIACKYKKSHVYNIHLKLNTRHLKSCLSLALSDWQHTAYATCTAFAQQILFFFSEGASLINYKAALRVQALAENLEHMGA